MDDGSYSPVTQDETAATIKGIVNTMHNTEVTTIQASLDAVQKLECDDVANRKKMKRALIVLFIAVIAILITLAAFVVIIASIYTKINLDEIPRHTMTITVNGAKTERTVSMIEVLPTLKEFRLIVVVSVIVALVVMGLIITTAIVGGIVFHYFTVTTRYRNNERKHMHNIFDKSRDTYLSVVPACKLTSEMVSDALTRISGLVMSPSENA
jgi:flagellar basal body-associated protein FliL